MRNESETATPDADASRTDAVKEAIVAYEMHRSCEGDKGRAYCPTSFYTCMEAQRFGPLVIALAAAEKRAKELEVEMACNAALTRKFATARHDRGACPCKQKRTEANDATK